MNYTIFYSWQSDLSNNTNRTAIQTCINKAIKNLSTGKPSGIIYSYDESTRDEVGTPDIAQTIIQKIDKSDIFVCDISIINKYSRLRKCPNPNVLFELGYAASSLGWDKVICIFNLTTGQIEKLPFDINHKRILTYSSDDENYKDNLTKAIEKSVESMVNKGLLYNPLKDHIKGKIDYCILASLKQVSCIVYGVCTMSDALEKVQELLSLTPAELKDKISDGHQILGFFAKNDLQEVRDKLDDIFIAITSSSIYPTKWALAVLKMIDWIRSYQWYISERSGISLCTNAKMSLSQFKIVYGHQLNPDNPANGCLLLKNVGHDRGQVLYSATMPLFDSHVLLTMQNIVQDNTAKYCDCFCRLLSIANEWLSSTGNEFILDPDYYEIT